jgi:hypothetical protein
MLAGSLAGFFLPYIGNLYAGKESVSNKSPDTTGLLRAVDLNFPAL